MAINGLFQVGNGQASLPTGFANLKTAFDALNLAGAFNGNVTLEVTSNIVNPPKAVLNSVNFSTFTLTIRFLTSHDGIARNPFQYIMDTASDEAMEFIDCVNGPLIIEGANIKHVLSTPTSVAKRTISFTGTQTISVDIHDTILQGGNKGQTAIYIGSAINVDMYNVILSKYNNQGTPGEGHGIEIAAGGTLRFESNTLHECGTALIAPNTQVMSLIDNSFINNDINFTPTGGLDNAIIGKYNGKTGGGAFGFLTETYTQDSLLPANEFFSTDLESFNYLRLKPSARSAELGAPLAVLQIGGNRHGIRLNNRGLNGTTSIGADEAVRYAKTKLRNVPPQAGGNSSAGNRMAESLTQEIPDHGANYAETRFLVLDHGRTSDTDPEARDPEWVDMTEFAGIYRMQKAPDIINVGTEGARPYRFKASSFALKMVNTDFAWDNLKKIDLVTVDGGPAKFRTTENGTNLDLKKRPARFVARFPKENMTVAYDLGSFRVNTIDTDSSGKASIRLESLEKDFIDKDAGTVKDGKNWYFDRSVKFLVQELIKSVRREYGAGIESIAGKDTISLAGIETFDSLRTYSEFGRPIVTVKPNGGDLKKGEKRLVVTAAAPRCIFRGTLNNDISIGSSFIQMKFSDAIDIKKGDVLTLGNAGGPNFDSMNEEKTVVLEDVSFSGVVDEVRNIRVSSLKKGHFADEIIERWVIYLGCSNGIEDVNESYVIVFDPDRDEYATMLSSNSGSTDGYLSNPVRFMHLSQTLRANKIPGPDESGEPSGYGQRLMACATPYSFPGKPNEPGSIYFWQIDTTKRWDEVHLILAAEAGNADPGSGGVYTGQMNFRSMKPMLTQSNIGAVDPTDISPSFFGAHGIGKFVEEVMRPNGQRILGFGFVAGLTEDLVSTADRLTVAAPASGTEMWGIQPVEKDNNLIFSGTVYVIGVTEEAIGRKEGIGETFYSDSLFFSGRINELGFPAPNQVRFHFDGQPGFEFSRKSSVVVVIPDSGKMYVSNCGENTVINESQDLNVAEWLGDDTGPGAQESKALDTEPSEGVIYHDKIAHIKKDEIDRAKPVVKIEKNKVDAKAVDPGYYSSIVEKRKLEVDKGDVLSINADQSSNFRIVPGQYTAQPFATELYRVYYPENPITVNPLGKSKVKTLAEMSTNNAILGDQPPLVYDSENSGGIDVNGNIESQTHPFMKAMFKQFSEQTDPRNRNIHVWNFPIIGLWEKFSSINKSLLAFDGSVIADNGNAELLGYWHLAYDTYEHQIDGDSTPRIDLGYVDADGVVHVEQPDQVTSEHFPVCTVLHNMTNHKGGSGTVSLDFWGSMTNEMRERLVHIVGGAFSVFSSFADGEPLVYKSIVRGIEYHYKYARWDPAGSQFTNQYPISMNTVPHGYNFDARIVLKFKKIRDPQAKGSLFVGAHCYPIRTRHLHLPYGESAFEDGSEIIVASEGRRTDAEPPPSREFSYPAKVVDANFQLGSEELLNQNPETGEFNPWCLDRYSQNKSIGMFSGAADNYASSGMLKGVSLNGLPIEIPLGYKATPPPDQPLDLKIRLSMNFTPLSFGKTIMAAGGSLNPFPNGYNPGQPFTINWKATNHGFTINDVGTIVKIDGLFKEDPQPGGPPNPLFPIPDDQFYTQLLDGLYEVIAVNATPGNYYIQLQYSRLNDTTFLGSWSGDQFGQMTSFWGYQNDHCFIKRYYGLDQTYLDIYVGPKMVELQGSGFLREFFGNTYQINTGDTFSYDNSLGELSYIGTVAPDKLEFSWNLSGTNPSKIDYSPWVVTKILGSGPDKMTSTLRTSAGQISVIPRFERQDIDHRDHLFGQPAPSPEYSLDSKSTFLSYRKILFNCAPTFGDVLNYPSVIYARSWGKFWRYFERRSTEGTKEVTRKTPFAYLSPINDFGDSGLDDNAPFNIFIRNYVSGAEFNLTDLATDPDGLNITYDSVGGNWNQWIREVVDRVNKQGVGYSLAVGPGVGDAFDSLYIFQNGPEYGKKDLTLDVRQVFGGNPCTISVVNAPANLNEIISDGDVFHMYNNRGGGNDYIYLQVVAGTVGGALFDAYGWTTFEPGGTVVGPAAIDPKSETNKRTQITRVGYWDGAKFVSVDSSNVRATSVDPDNQHYRDRYGGIQLVNMDGSSVGNVISLKDGKNYGAGDGVFDAGIKPMAFGDTFINAMGKWYLSRYDHDGKILADTYTINHDGPFLGDDARLYSIVYQHPSHPAVSRFPFLKFAMGAQSNFLVPSTTNNLFFARAKFVDVGMEMQIQYNLAQYTEAFGIQNYPVFHSFTPGYISIQGTEALIKSDFEIHGIFSSSIDATLSCGIMRWANRGNANKESLTQYAYRFLPQAAYFSENLLASTTNGSDWTFTRWRNEQTFGHSVAYAAQYIASFAETEITPGIHYTFTLPMQTIPLGIKNGGVLQLYTASAVPPAGQWTYAWNGKNWDIIIGTDNGKISGGVDFGYASPTAIVSNNDYRSSRFGAEGSHAWMSYFKGWTFQQYLDAIVTTDPANNKGMLRGIVMKRHDLNSSDKAKRDKREDLMRFHAQPSTASVSYFEGASSAMFPFALTAIKEFNDFRVSGQNGFFFTNNFDNEMKRWNGLYPSGSYIQTLSLNTPTVEGDFNQYFPMVKIGSAYEEIFGFSMGSKAHAATQSFKGGRNIIWKFSKSLSFHISVADFEGLNVWDALGNFAELTDCVVGFDRFGNLRFEPRPIVDSSTAFFFTFDNIEEQNLISIKKKSAYQSVYNEIEVVPYRPELPPVTSNMVSQSDLNVASANNDLFVKDQGLDFSEKAPDKARPEIKAFQRDFKRKRILLVCTNGQFDTEEQESKGLFSRFKYQIIEDLIELRLAADAESGANTLVLNKLPFDSQVNDIAFKVGDRLFVGLFEFWITAINPDNSSVEIAPGVLLNQRFEAGTPVVISSSEQQEKIFFAEGSGTYSFIDGSNQTANGFTFSPKTFFVEIGEWSFDDNPNMKRRTTLTSNIGPASTLIPVESTVGFPDSGALSIAGTKIAYKGTSSTAFLVDGPIAFDISAGLKVTLMPEAPVQGGVSNPNYSPSPWLYGGPDELGSSCLNEYHLFDPNEDGQPYFDGAPEFGGKPITALDFYAKGQKTISYTDPANSLNDNLPNTMSNNYGGGQDYRARHRTHVAMKINFNGFRFSDGDRIELDVPGIKLAPQQHLTKVFSDFHSIKRNGLRQYPATKNRFFNNSSAEYVGKRILDRVSRIDEEVQVVGYISDINDLDWLSTIRIIDNRMFGSYPNNQAIGYVKSLKFNQNNGTVTITAITQRT